MTLRAILFHPIPLFPRRKSRLKVEDVIRLAEIPEPAKALVTDVVRQTRLKRHEKLEVAEEMVAHFEDAYRARSDNPTMPDPAGSFGDVAVAAKLIRRGKIRNRSWLWHSFRAVRWAAAGTAVVYVGLGAHFLAGKPTVTVDYIEKCNVESGARSADGAWPLYRAALLKLPKSLNDPIKDAEPPRLLMEVRPGEPNWDRLVATLTEAAPSLELARQAAARPVLGFVWGYDGSANDPELWPVPPGTVRPGSKDEELFGVLLPNMSSLRQLAMTLVADARWAAEQKDSKRFVADIEALIGMSRQLFAKPSPLVGNLVGIGFADLALQELDYTLRTSPEFLSDGDLVRLAHLLDGPKVTGDVLDLTVERYFTYDLVQRMYTDDGDGDGRFTPAGIYKLERLNSMYSAPGPQQERRPYIYAISGAAPVLFAGRKETLDLYDRIMDLASINYSLPSYRADWATVNRLREEVRGSSSTSARHPLLQILLPSLSHAQLTAERFLAQRDAVQIVIAAELYRRRNGTYPATLESLVPQYLPKMPLDPVNGLPILYALRDGKPLIYSRGADRDDDQGQSAAKVTGKSRQYRVMDWIDESKPPEDGDWVISPYPQGE